MNIPLFDNYPWKGRVRRSQLRLPTGGESRNPVRWPICEFMKESIQANSPPSIPSKYSMLSLPSLAHLCLLEVSHPLEPLFFTLVDIFSHWCFYEWGWKKEEENNNHKNLSVFQLVLCSPFSIWWERKHKFVCQAWPEPKVEPSHGRLAESRWLRAPEAGEIRYCRPRGTNLGLENILVMSAMCRRPVLPSLEMLIKMQVLGPPTDSLNQTAKNIRELAFLPIC